MFASHPWTYYLIIVSTLMVGYYLVIGLKFYAYDIKMLINARKRRTIHTAANRQIETKRADFNSDPGKFTTDLPDQLQQDEEPGVWEHEQLFEQTEELAIRLKEIIGQARQKEDNNEELVRLIQLTIQEYMVPNGTPFQAAINTLIESEYAANGLQHLSADEKVLIWKQVV